MQAQVNVSDFEPDRDIKAYLPPITPAGTFKMEFRIHDGKNRTYAEVETLSEVHHIGLSDFISIG